MKTQVIKFPNRFLPAIRRAEKCAVVKLPVVRTPRECPKVQGLRRRARQWLDRDKSKFSGGTCSGGEG